MKELPTEQGISVAQKEPEKGLEIKRFTDKEKRVLEEVGAVVYSITGQTITGQIETGKQQIELQKQKSKPSSYFVADARTYSFYYVIDAGDRLTALPSMLSEVAIYPDPKRFFVPNTGGKTLAEQEKLVEKDAEKLREILGLEEIDEVIPEEAATLTELTFKHLAKTGIWLFGRDYNYLYGSTKNPTDESGSYVAAVGYAGVIRKIWVAGLCVDRWSPNSIGGVVDDKVLALTVGGGPHNFSNSVHAVRLIVPKGNR